jgi:DNA processing protein
VDRVAPPPADPRALETAVAMAELRPPGDAPFARAFWEAVRRVTGAARPEDLVDLLELIAVSVGVAPEDWRQLVESARPRARASLARARASGVTPVPWFDAAYPPRLAAIPDPPIVLWTRGDPAALAEPAVAVIGSRQATPTGLAVARRLAADLAEAGLCVVSGLARGVDGAAHRAALDVGRSTVAVLGCGVDIVYPREHAPLAARIVETGALISEFSPGTPPLPRHFPIRNRIISGLSLAVVIVEASDKSGSLITARTALDQGRDVLAVPGSVLSGQYRGSHALIKDGARLVETVTDVLEEIGWVAPARAAGPGGTRPGGPRLTGPVGPNLTRDGSAAHPTAVEQVMAPGEPYSVDDLAVRTRWTTHDLLAEIGRLEVRGRITRTAGGRFVRLDDRASDREEHGQGTRRRRIAVEGEDDQQIPGA